MLVKTSGYAVLACSWLLVVLVVVARSACPVSWPRSWLPTWPAGTIRRPVSFTLDRYGHLYPEADTALHDRLDVLYGTSRPTSEGTVVRLHGPGGRGPSVAPGGDGDDKSAADDGSATL